jgi:hypothetical protein
MKTYKTYTKEQDIKDFEEDELGKDTSSDKTVSKEEETKEETNENV